jgi:hypothetical protein
MVTAVLAGRLVVELDQLALPKGPEARGSDVLEVREHGAIDRGTHEYAPTLVIPPFLDAPANGQHRCVRMRCIEASLCQGLGSGALKRPAGDGRSLGGGSGQ